MRFRGIVKRIRSLSGALHSIQVMERTPVSADGKPVVMAPGELEDHLESFVRSLPLGVLYLLLTVYYVSRGDLEEPGQLLGLYEHLSNRFSKKNRVLDELLQDPAYLSTRLDYGLQLLTRAHQQA
jgi:hypothetical protein